MEDLKQSEIREEKKKLKRRKRLSDAVKHFTNVSQNSKHEPVLKKEVTSCPSSLIQIGTGVPQYRFLDTAQSRASRSQLPNLFSFTKSGTLSKTRELR